MHLIMSEDATLPRIDLRSTFVTFGSDSDKPCKIGRLSKFVLIFQGLNL